MRQLVPLIGLQVSHNGSFLPVETSPMITTEMQVIVVKDDALYKVPKLLWRAICR